MTKKFTGSFINCFTCNKKFYVPKYRIGIAKFCSDKCRGNSAKQQFSKPCEICGEVFSFIACRIDKAKFCSRQCYYKGRRNKGTVDFECQNCHMIFKTSPSHKRKFCSRKCNGLHKFKTLTGNFTTVRRAMVIRGLFKQCEECGYDKNLKILGVHHKDQNRENNDRENLIILCPNCHSLIHNKHIVH